MPPVAKVQVTPPDSARKGTLVTFKGIGFLSSSPVNLNFANNGIIIQVQTNPGGVFDTTGVFSWQPIREGIYHLIASDGTNTVELDYQVWT